MNTPHSLEAQKPKRTKVCIYCEVPPTLDSSHLTEWLKALLQFQSGKANMQFYQLKQSRKYKKKPRFLKFTVDPKRVREAYFQAGQIMVLPLGDAQLDPDYRLGKGLLNGFLRLKALLKNIVVTEAGGIDVCRLDYQRDVDYLMDEHAAEISVLYQRRREKIFNDLMAEKLNYQMALEQTQDTTVKANIEHGLIQLQEKITAHAMELYTRFMKDCKFAINEDGSLRASHFSRLDERLIAIMNLVPPQSIEYQMMKNTLFSIYTKLIDLSYKFVPQGPHFYSSIFDSTIHKSLRLFENYFRDKPDPEVIRLYESSIVLDIEKKKFSNATDTILKLLTITPELKSAQTISDIHAKQVDNLITISKLALVTNENTQPQDSKLYEKLNQAYEKMKDKADIQKDKLLALENQLAVCRLKWFSPSPSETQPTPRLGRKSI